MRIDPAEYRALKLETHSVLHDVPLHDVSGIDLPGGGEGRTIAQLQALIPLDEQMRVNRVVRTLFDIRRAVGALLGWDRDADSLSPSSYIHRLPEDIRQRSQVPPGTREGLFHVVYRLDTESLQEIRNATVHAFLCAVLQPRAGGYRLYWAVYVKRVSWLTPVYMTAIEPFRRFLVYPTVLNRIRHAWMNAYPATPRESA